MAETTDQVRAAKREGGDEMNFRRFGDKVTWGAIGLTLTLVATVWAITWRVTDVKASDAHRRLDDSNSSQQKHAERIIRLEVLQDTNERALKAIDDKQSKMDGKLDAYQQQTQATLQAIRDEIKRAAK
jgi:hypothetical protein